MKRNLTSMIGVPLDSAGYANGLELMPAELRSVGLIKRLGLRDYGDWDTILDDRTRDPKTGWIAYEQICQASRLIESELTHLLDADEKPLLVGGCCTMLIGIASALRKKYGRVGLAFLDGHVDFYDGQTSLTGEGADMELSTLVGIGVPGLVDIAGTVPLMDETAIEVIGPRDEEDALSKNALNPRQVKPRMPIYDVAEVRRMGALELGHRVAKRFEHDYGKFWLHLDLDVISGEFFPAVDYPMDGGLTWEETTDLLRPLAVSPALLGVNLTIYNPKLDRDGRYAKQIVDMLVEVF
jgi:arginase